MALQDAILAALAHDESSGYDLAKAFDISVANYWTGSPQQLYRELDRMEVEGLVRARVVTQSTRPNKRVFRLTAAGRKALRAFTARNPKPMAIRDEMLVQVAALESGDPATIRANVAERLMAFEEKLAIYLVAQERTLAGRTEEDYLATQERVGQYLTLLRGISFEQENIRWAQMVLQTLGDRADG